jgi:hypothetical protein
LAIIPNVNSFDADDPKIAQSVTGATFQPKTAKVPFVKLAPRQISSSSVESADSAVADIVGSRNVSQYFSRLSTSNSLPSLMTGQFWFATEGNAPSFCALTAFSGSCPDQFPFELGKTAKDC